MNLVKEIQKSNDRRSYILLLNQYKPLIKSLTYSFKSKYYAVPMELSDIENMLQFFFYELVLEYDENSKKMFPSFIKEFLFYKGSSWLRGYITLNNKVLNFADEIAEDIRSSEQIKEHIETELLDIENMTYLSKLEKQVINYNKDGVSIKQISSKLDINEKTLYAARARAIKKIRKENLERL